MLTTTLNKILQAEPCSYGWLKLTGQSLRRIEWVGNDKELTVLSILESNGIEDALWALRYCTQHHKAFISLLLAKHFGRPYDYTCDYYATADCVVCRGNRKHYYHMDEQILYNEFLAFIRSNDNGNS